MGRVNRVHRFRLAGLAPTIFPIVGELWEKQDEKVEKNKVRDVSVKKTINVYFCVAYSRYFSTAIVIPSGVLNRLAKLTSRKPSTQEEAVDSIYPAHANVLRKAGLAPPAFPNNERTVGKTV